MHKKISGVMSPSDSRAALIEARKEYDLVIQHTKDKKHEHR
jgi:hypothetical protein